jgi:hypothetical protein
MSEQSSTDLITATNTILENIGERRVLSITTPVARKATVALQQAVYDIASLNSWEWLKEFIPAVSWVNERADLGDTSRVHSVQWGSSVDGYRQIPWIDPREFDYLPLQSYSDSNTKPRFFTQETYNIVKVNPYPSTATEQGRIRFYVTREMVPPYNPDDFFPLPERHMSMVYFRAQHYLATSHLDDKELAATWGQQFDMYVQRIRDKERLAPTFGGNIFKLQGR